MIPVSDEFLLKVRKPHKVVTKCQIYRGDLIWEGRISDGNVTLDADAKVLRSLTLTINEDLDVLVPQVSQDLLVPFGTEIRVSRGLQYADGSQELVPQGGPFVIKTARTVESGEGLQVFLTAEDLSKKVRDARLQKTVVILANGNLGAAIKKVIQEAAPWVTFASNFELIATDKTVGMAFEQASDGWEAAHKMAFDAGYRLFFNIDGHLDLKLIPTTNLEATTPVWEFVEGDGGNLLYADKAHEVEKTYNKVIVTGEPTSGINTPTLGIAEDTNPNSPTYINGPFGVKPFFYKSQFIRTKAQAQRTAANLLIQKLGFQENLHIQAVPMEALQEDDVVHVVRERAGIDANYRINKITMPLVHDRAMDVIMAERTIGGITLS